MPIRVLVGMTGRFARQQIELRTDAFWRDHWWWALPGVLLTCAVAAGLGLLLPDISLPLWIVMPMMVLPALWAIRSDVYGTYPLEMGAEAEAWTSKELRRACGPGWHVVDGISFAYHDVDHVLVGPGGVYAIETKYTDSSIDLTTRRGQEWATRWSQQAAEGARGIKLLLREHHVETVHPGVVAWGSELAGTGRFVEGVFIMARKDLNDPDRPWNSAAQTLTREKVQTIIGELLRYRELRSQYSRS